MHVGIRTTIVLAALLLVPATGRGAGEPVFGPADPVVHDDASFDPKRPPAAEMRLGVRDGFTVGITGDLITSRPLIQEAGRLPGFKAVLDLLKRNDVLYGNLETTILDLRSFGGAPYSWDGDWTNSSLPGVAADLKAMGFGIVSRANNHALDWGLEGMRETGRYLDAVGIVHAGAGETLGAARAAQYLDTPGGRVALVSFATTFRPSSDAMAAEGAAPGRPGLSALHLTRTIELPPDGMKALAAASCAAYHTHCGETPASLDLFGTSYRQGDRFAYRYEMDQEDLAGILKSIREAKQNADLVIVAIHTHECSIGCDDDNAPRNPGDFLATLAHQAIDSGADIFATTGNHNLGPIEIYASPARGKRPIFYGLGDFFWSDIQVPLPRELFQGNRALLAQAWTDPAKATSYDLTAPLNHGSFMHDFTFRSVFARCRFAGGQLAEVALYPVDEGYGTKLTESGIPRLADAATATEIIGEITARNRDYGLPPLRLSQADGATIIQP